MAKTLIFLCCIICCISCKSQSLVVKRKGELVSLPKYYSADGVIIHNEPFFLKSKLNLKESYLPKDSDLFQAERILEENLVKEVNQRNGNQTLNIATGKALYKDWNRQYFSFIDTNNDKIVLIELLKCCHSVKKCYPDWQNQIVLKLSEDPCVQSARYLVNLSKNSMSIP